MDNRPSMLKPTLIGGASLGAAAALPVVGWLNCACCALVAGGGFLAAYLYSRDCRVAGVPFRAGNGALVGLVAGLFYSVASTIVGGLVRLALGFSLDQMLDQMESMGVEIPPELQEGFEWAAAAGPLLLLVLGFFVTLLIAAIFSTIGGLIGGAVFKVEPAPPAPTVSGTPPPPPPAPPAAPPGGGAPPAGP